MAVEEKILWKIYAGALGAATTLLTQKLITKAWETATGDVPPDPNDPDTPLTQALIWALCSGRGHGPTHDESLHAPPLVLEHWPQEPRPAA